jgi:hypothetical protein
MMDITPLGANLCVYFIRINYYIHTLAGETCLSGRHICQIEQFYPCLRLHPDQESFTAV